MSGTQFRTQGAPDQRTAAPERPEANPEMVVVAGGEVSCCLVMIARRESRAYPGYSGWHHKHHLHLQASRPQASYFKASELHGSKKQITCGS
jgi:hypothetical protein